MRAVLNRLKFAVAVVAGLFSTGLAAAQTMLISNELGNSISTYNVGNGAIGTLHTGIANPDGIAFGPDGFVYSTSFTGGTFNRVTGPNSFTTIASGMNGAAGFVRDAAGFHYVVSFGNPSGGGVNLSRIAPDGSIAISWVTGLSTPDDVKFNADHSFLFVSEWGGNRIRRINPSTGVMTTFVDTAAGLDRPSSMAFDLADNLYVTNWTNGTVSRITPDGTVTHNFATNVPNSFGLLLDETAGFFYATGWNDGTLRRFGTGGGAATVIATGFTGPTFMTFVPVPEPAGILAVVAAVLAVGIFVRRLAATRRVLP